MTVELIFLTAGFAKAVVSSFFGKSLPTNIAGSLLMVIRTQRAGSWGWWALFLGLFLTRWLVRL